MEFIYDILVVGAVLLVWNNFLGVSGELEVL